jgi:acylphosphatase
VNPVPPPGRQRLVAIVRGVVQGVGFRWFVEREASALGVDGWVTNRMDGSVEVVAEGTAEQLRELVALLWRGPAAAGVSDVEVRYEPVRGLAGFAIRSGFHRGD